jgi:hypothetical protein
VHWLTIWNAVGLPPAWTILGRHHSVSCAVVASPSNAAKQYRAPRCNGPPRAGPRQRRRFILKFPILPNFKSYDEWADVLADPRARKRERRTDLAVKQAFYRLADEKRETILVACSKCDWRAAFARDELIAAHGADYPMPNLLNHLAAPGCSRLGSQWDRCGVHYVEPIEGARY